PTSRMLCNMVLVICFKDTVMRYRDWHISKKSFALGEKYCNTSETGGDNMTQGILSFPWHILEDQISHSHLTERDLSSKRPPKITQPNPPGTGRDTFHQTRLFRAPSNLALSTVRNVASTVSLGSLCLRVSVGQQGPAINLWLKRETAAVATELFSSAHDNDGACEALLTCTGGHGVPQGPLSQKKRKRHPQLVVMDACGAVAENSGPSDLSVMVYHILGACGHVSLDLDLDLSQRVDAQEILYGTS
ncbi:hypothetical protein HGM15179_006433, partial [Zosterops borbonicus]